MNKCPYCRAVCNPLVFWTRFHNTYTCYRCHKHSEAPKRQNAVAAGLSAGAAVLLTSSWHGWQRYAAIALVMFVLLLVKDLFVVRLQPLPQAREDRRA